MVTPYYIMKMSKNRSNRSLSTYYSDLLKKYMTTEDLHSKCRICLQKGSVSIFETEDGMDLIETLQNLGEIHISDDDDYTKLLCDTCYNFTKTAMLFRSLAKRSDHLQRQSVKEENVLCHSQDSTNDYDNTSYDTKEPEKWPIDDYNSFTQVKKEDILEKGKYATKVTCHICNKVISRSYYKEHITMHDPDHKKYVCDVCGKSFRLRCSYHNHSLRHRNDFPYKCTFCPYKARYAELLKTHLRTHTGDYRYMCTECPARFLFKSNLNSHVLRHKEPQFKCDSCKRAFHTKLKLQRHFEADHLGIKNHVCNMCGKAFGYRNAMMKHQRHVHKREKLLFGRMPSYLAAEHKKDGL